MLTLLWPDPNRHGSTTPKPPATAEEGRALVNLATTIVGWAKDGLITGGDRVLRRQLPFRFRDGPGFPPDPRICFEGEAVASG
jgi:hypothetical protein